MRNSRKSGKKSTGRVELGKIELDRDEFDPKYAKERITIWLDEAIVDGFRKRAAAQGTKYQTLINEALREALRRPSLVERIEAIEEKIGLKTG